MKRFHQPSSMCEVFAFTESSVQRCRGAIIRLHGNRRYVLTRTSIITESSRTMISNAWWLKLSTVLCVETLVCPTIDSWCCLHCRWSFGCSIQLYQLQTEHFPQKVNVYKCDAFCICSATYPVLGCVHIAYVTSPGTFTRRGSRCSKRVS